MENTKILENIIQSTKSRQVCEAGKLMMIFKGTLSYALPTHGDEERRMGHVLLCISVLYLYLLLSNI